MCAFSSVHCKQAVLPILELVHCLAHLGPSNEMMNTKCYKSWDVKFIGVLFGNAAHAIACACLFGNKNSDASAVEGTKQICGQKEHTHVHMPLVKILHKTFPHPFKNANWVLETGHLERRSQPVQVSNARSHSKRRQPIFVSLSLGSADGSLQGETQWSSCGCTGSTQHEQALLKKDIACSWCSMLEHFIKCSS